MEHSVIGDTRMEMKSVGHNTAILMAREICISLYQKINKS